MPANIYGEKIGVKGLDSPVLVSVLILMFVSLTRFIFYDNLIARQLSDYYCTNPYSWYSKTIAGMT